MKRNNNHAHWIMKIWSCYACKHPDEYREVIAPYFDGTRAQAVRFFRRHEAFKRYGNRDGYLVTIESHDTLSDNRKAGRDY